MPPVFLSYHHADGDAVADFMQRFGQRLGDVYSVGVSDGDDFVSGCTDDHVLQRIREKYIKDAAVTIVLLGASTWGRRFVDWEIAASIACGPGLNSRLGLLAISLPDASGVRRLPPRLEACFSSGDHNAVWRGEPPSSSGELLRWVAQVAASRAAKTPSKLGPLLRRDLNS